MFFSYSSRSPLLPSSFSFVYFVFMRRFHFRVSFLRFSHHSFFFFASYSFSSCLSALSFPCLALSFIFVTEKAKKQERKGTERPRSSKMPTRSLECTKTQIYFCSKQNPGDHQAHKRAGGHVNKKRLLCGATRRTTQDRKPKLGKQRSSIGKAASCQGRGPSQLKQCAATNVDMHVLLDRSGKKEQGGAHHTIKSTHAIIS